MEVYVFLDMDLVKDFFVGSGNKNKMKEVDWNYLID